MITTKSLKNNINVVQYYYKITTKNWLRIYNITHNHSSKKKFFFSSDNDVTHHQCWASNCR